MNYWLYLFVASLFEVCWIYSLKFLNFKGIIGVKWSILLADINQWKLFLPLGGYIVFGLCNIYCFSMAVKGIPASTAFGVWMGLALVFSKLFDVLIFGEPYNFQQIFFTGVVLAGIVGLKYYTK